MGLSRLDNFLKSARGTILYVNPNDLDSTDSIENLGNSLTRPFKTIQRALIESARFSYQRGLNNDRFGKTTILVYPGDHIIDNRPGWIPDGANNFITRNGTTSDQLVPFELNTNFDVNTSSNELYKLNSVHGGVIIPRGTSLIGLDLRKTKIRPKYVPNPSNTNIERSSIFRVTGECYFWQFSIFDSDPNDLCYIDYTQNLFVPNFSHHKLSCFEYADGTNNVSISDEFLNYSSDRTDLDMYYEKIGIVYGNSSGRPVEPDYPSSTLDIQPKVDEYRIVGSTGNIVGITSIRAGDGANSTTSITVTTDVPLDGLEVDTPFQISGVSDVGYNGKYVVTEKVNANEIKFNVQNAPPNPLPTSLVGSSLALTSDTVTSASPYIFNVSLRSVYGMCGVLADGSKASGFKSMVIAQFTGIGLQKDDNAFVLFDEDTGTYKDSTVPGNENISTNSRAIFKPDYRNFHIKAINDAFIQNVSIFAIGYAEHFVTESGGDMSITNSNSNFGAKALVASGYRKDAFPQDDLGYITHIIPPKEIDNKENTLEFNSIDVEKTILVGLSSHLYLYNETNIDVPPENVIEGYRIGARENDYLHLLVSIGGTTTEYASRIVMPNTLSSSEKRYDVIDNSLSVLKLQSDHTLQTGESVRVVGDAKIPDGILNNRVYYAITSSNDIGIGSSEIKLAKTQSDALSHTNSTPRNIDFTEFNQRLKVISRVSDKNSGDIGHPIQFDSAQGWYINVSPTSLENGIYHAISALGQSSLGKSTTRTYIKRKEDGRNTNDTIYRVRYIIPKDRSFVAARPPSDGFILQESGTTTGASQSEIQTYFGSGSLTNLNQQRNFRFISGANWQNGTVNITTELPHNLFVGNTVEILNVSSSSNPSATNNVGFNGTYIVSGITSSRTFSFEKSSNPGTFSSNTSSRTTSLPHFKKKEHNTIFYIYRNQEIQPYISGEQDGIYYLTVLNSSNSPTEDPFTEEKFSQPVKDLYPQVDRDNPQSDPKESVSYASNSLIGGVYIDNVKNSITKETLNKKVLDSGVVLGNGISDIVSSSASLHTIKTNIDHGLNRLTRVTIGVGQSGVGYGTGVEQEIYNANLVGFAGSTTGLYATARVSVNANGNITDVKIIHGGSSYGIGNTLTVEGIPTFGSVTPAVLTVQSIYNNVGDVISVSGIKSDYYSSFNQLYRITNIPTGNVTDISVASDTSISEWSAGGIDSINMNESIAYLTGPSISVQSISYNNVTGIATVITNSFHGLRVDNKIRITGADESFYNGSFVVKEVVGTGGKTLNVNIGVSDSIPSTTGTIYIYREGFTSNYGNITIDNENINGRMIPVYAGITTTLTSSILDANTESINIRNISSLDINIGDYLSIDDEIVRVKNTVPSNPTNPIVVFRGVLGTKSTSHFVNSVVRRIKVDPVELRRHSISRASGHTFEYVGFGPGNYSTAFPSKQDRQISVEEELLAQSTRRSGGINFYSGMNDKGISYSGNKKLSTVTGQEEIFDTPVQTITGEDISNLVGINVISPIEGIFSRSIKVDGGNDGNAISQFNGPVIIRNKLTSTSDKGIEANSLFLQGDSNVSRKYTVGISTPILSGTIGDVVFNASPTRGGQVGWVFSDENDWRKFGNISLEIARNVNVYDAIGIGTTSPGSDYLKISSGSSGFNVNQSGEVGIGTTSNGYKLNVNGNVNVSNALSIGGTIFVKNGLYDINNKSGSPGDVIISTGAGVTWATVNALFGWSFTALADGLYNTSLNFVGIGTTVPRYSLEVGSVGFAETSLYVNGKSVFTNTISAQAITVNNTLTATTSSHILSSSDGQINSGIITAITSLRSSKMLSNSFGVGIGTDSPRADLDIQGRVRFTTYFEVVEKLSTVSDPAGNFVIVDLSKAQTFELDTTLPVDRFVLQNVPPGSTSFTIKINQKAAPYFVNIDNFVDFDQSNSIPIYWPGGGVIPTVTNISNRTDLYSFKTFDSGFSLYGVVGGQNFA